MHGLLARLFKYSFMKYSLLTAFQFAYVAIMHAQNVGIGTSTPNAPLQFGNQAQNRMVVLYEHFNNDHQFYGLGINAGIFRYQTATSADDHVFYAGLNASSSRELLRVKGNGNVGIGTPTPNASLQFANTTLNRKIVLFEVLNNDHQFYGFGINSGTLRYQTGALGDAHVFYAGQSTTASRELLRIQGNGHVGIGNSNPRAPLHFAQEVRNRKIVLWSSEDNEHQFYGFGINGFTLRYQTPSPTDDHVFYTGASASTSTELMRLKGTGALAFAGNTGSPGNVLVSTGTSTSPAWRTPPGRYAQVFQTQEIQDPAGGDGRLVPGLVTIINLEQPAMVVLHVRLHISVSSCVACEPNLTYVTVQRVLPNGDVALVGAFPVTTPVGKVNAFSSGPIILEEPAGQHVFRVAFSNYGPVSESSVTRIYGGGTQPGVLAWQIFYN